MICPNCSKEIPDESAYCIYCHTPIDVDDIDLNLDVLEDNELLDVYIEKKEEQDKIKEKKEKEKILDDSKRKKKRAVVLIVILLLVVISFLAFILYSNSSSTKLKNAQKAYALNDYDKAYYLFEDLIISNPKKDILISSYIGVGQCAVSDSSYYDKGEEYLLNLMNATNISDFEKEEAFNVLIDLYAKNKKQDKMLEIKNKYADSDKLVSIYKEKAIDLPVFSLEEGEYDEEIEVFLSSISGSKIYYTLDGKDPSKGNGKLYEKEIELDEGTHTIRACCLKDDVFGPISEKTYTITYTAPEYPSVYPTNGTFYEETWVTITSNTPNSKIYYTWDGTTPSIYSNLYYEPLYIPEGNNVLSIVVINDSGKSSDVIKYNYTYIMQ